MADTPAKPMKLLVTGGAGYIGSVCAARLLEAGHEVVVLDDLTTGHRDAVPAGARLVEARVHDAGDVLDPTFDGVLHFAGRSLVAESVARPELYWDNNVVGSLALLAAVRAHRVPRFVFSSSAATYGEPATTPITEDTPATPVNAYGASKLATDLALAAEATAYGLAAVSLRYFNVGGAFRSGGGHYGERHSPESHLVPNLLTVATGGREAASVFGTDYPTRDGTTIRDYLHVVDLADAHLRALARTREGEHAIYNLGTGTGYTVREVVEAVRRVTHHAVPVVEEPRRPGDPAALVASHARARKELGWSPLRGLDKIVGDAWDFMRPGRQVPDV